MFFTVSEIQQKLEYYCAYQDRCWQDVETKLREFTLIPEAREQIIVHLSQHGFVDEERFALKYARSKFNQKKWGKKKIAHKLNQKKVGKKLIEQALEELEVNDYNETLRQLIAKKKHELRTEKNHWQRKQKLQRFLIQRGFSYPEFKGLITEEI